MKKNIIILMGLIFCLSSCYKDKTQIGNKEISEIKYESGILDEAYNLDKWSKLEIAPVLTQLDTKKELKYEWQIDYKVVSTDKNLNYICDTLGHFVCRYKVYNTDGATFKTFNLNVNSPYNSGLVIMSNNKGSGMISFKRTDLSDEELSTSKALVDCFNKENPKVGLGELGNISYTYSNGEYYFYLACKNPDKIIKFNPSTFKAMMYVDLKYSGYNSMIGSSRGLIINYGDGELIQYFAGGDNAFFKSLYNDIKDLDLEETPNISPKMAYLNNNYLDCGNLLFDIANSKLLVYKNYNVSILEDYDFTNMSLLNMTNSDETHNVLTLFKDNISNTYSMYYFDTTSESIKNKVDFNSTMDDKTIMLACLTSETNVLYTYGKSIYRFNYLASNIPTSPFIVLDKDVEIRSMVFSSDNKKLYVLTYDKDSSSELKSSIYCYNYEDAKLDWKEDELAADAIGMYYKD